MNISAMFYTDLPKRVFLFVKSGYKYREVHKMNVAVLLSEKECRQ